MADPFESRALNLMREKLDEDLQAVHENLGKGGHIIREDAAATGMNTSRLVGQIEGLKLARQRLKDTDEDLSNRPKDKGLEKE